MPLSPSPSHTYPSTHTLTAVFIILEDVGCEEDYAVIVEHKEEPDQPEQRGGLPHPILEEEHEEILVPLQKMYKERDYNGMTRDTRTLLGGKIEVVYPCILAPNPLLHKSCTVAKWLLEVGWV